MLRIASIDYKRYPFLADPSEFVRKRWPGLGIVDLIITKSGVIYERAMDIIRNVIENASIGKPRYITEEEVVSFYAALMIIAMVGSRWLVDRFALTYSKYSALLLKREPPETVEAIAKRVGIDLIYDPVKAPRIPLGFKRGTLVYRILPYSMSIKDYLVYGKRLINDPKYALVNQIVDGGRVYLEPDIAIRIVEEAITQYIKSMIKPIEEIPSELVDVVKEIKNILARTSKEGVGDQGFSEEARVIDFNKFPPCMKKIIEDLRNGENLSHHARFTVAAFLARIGLDVDNILELFRKTPDFNERIARYQIEHIAGLRGSKKKYMPYSCQTMKSLGLCPIDGDCGGKNPLVVYWRNIRRGIKKTSFKKNA